LKKEKELKLLEIIASFRKEWVQAKDIVKKAKKNGYSEPTVFRYLEKLTKSAILENKHDEYKESLYRVNPKKMPKELWEKTILKLEASQLINEKVREFAKSHNRTEVFKDLAQWLGALTLYSILVAAEKGRESLLEIPAYYIAEGGADGFIRRPIAYSMVSENDSVEEYIKKLQYYQQPSTQLAERKEIQPALTETREALELAFGKEKIQQLQEAFDKVLKEGKSNYQLSGEN
jgi:Fe2+ or Zn2+ uptake regulation protein